jgi:hypothetical protein
MGKFVTLLERLEALAADWASRQYNTPYSRESTEAIAKHEGREDAFHDAADELRAVLAEYNGREP